MQSLKVFISYSHRDERWVREFADVLRSEHVDVILSSGMPASSNWEEWLRKAIDESDFVVTLVTPESAGSPNMLFELGAAEALEKPIVAIVPPLRDVMLPLVRTRQSFPRSTPRRTARRILTDLLSPVAA